MTLVCACMHKVTHNMANTFLIAVPALDLYSMVIRHT